MSARRSSPEVLPFSAMSIQRGRHRLEEAARPRRDAALVTCDIAELDAEMYASVFAEDSVFERAEGVVHRGRAAAGELHARSAGTPSSGLYRLMWS